MSETAEENEEGGVGVFAEEEASKKKKKQDDGVSKLFWLFNIFVYFIRKNKLMKQWTKRKDTLSAVKLTMLTD